LRVEGLCPTFFVTNAVTAIHLVRRFVLRAAQF
jgi:hypothetical protein